MQKMLQRGFTLIELLVVIAIIGILAAVVLASLNDARSSGSDAAIKQTMGNLRSQAEIYYNQQGFSYAGMCAANTALLNSAASNGLDADGNVSTVNTQASSATVGVCHSTNQSWAAQIPLATGESWCVDSSGRAIQTTTVLASNDYTCN